MGIPKLPEIPSIPSLPSPADGPAGTMCRKLEGKLDKGLSEMGKIRNSAWNALNDVKGALADMVGQAASPLNEMTDALDGLKNAASDAMPSFPVGTDQLEDMLKNCGILKDDLPKMSGSSLFDDFSKSVGLNFDLSIGDYFDGIDLPEFGIGKMFDDLASKLDFLDTSGILSGLDGLLNCLDSMCGSDLSGKVDHANDLVDGMGLDVKGALDTDKLMSDSGISSSQISNINSVKSANEENKFDLKQSTQNAGDSLVTSVKKYKDDLIGAVAPANPFA